VGSIRSGLHVNFPPEDVSDLDLIITSSKPVVPYEGLYLPAIYDMLKVTGGEGHIAGKDVRTN